MPSQGTGSTATTSTATPRPRRWRRVLTLAAGVAAAVVLVAGVVAVRAYRGALRSNVGELSFANPLRIPPLADARTDPAGREVFDLTVATGTSRFLDDTQTSTWGINRDYLGPTLRARTGSDVQVNVTNDLDETTTLHWHGMHLPARADGGPHQTIAPGATWRPSWTVDQPPATLWYHAHPQGATGDQVYQGVAGLFLVDDPTTDAALPHRYGVDDIPLIIQDKNFTSDGQLDTGASRFSPIGPLGDEILVNGTHDPHLTVTTTRVRFRLLNASNARTYDLGFTDDRTFVQVATDAGLLPAPQELTRLRLAPSERAEIVVDVARGDDVILRSYPTGIGGGRLPARFAGADDTFDILHLFAAERLAPSPALPERLPAPPPIEAPDDAPRRTFDFNHASRINGRHYDPDRIDFTVTAGSTEVWELRNTSDNPHVFHVHGTSFTVTRYNGDPPLPELRGLKDSVLVPAGITATIAVPFGEHTDPDQSFMYHCHLLAHEDHGMMGQFTVTPPSDRPTASDQNDPTTPG